MSAAAAEQAWDRIDVWLAAHAPATFALLRPPASEEEVAAVQRRMGITFPPDLVATLRRHDGAAGDFSLPTQDRLLGTGGCEERSGFLRGMLTEVLDEDADDEEDDGAYWHRHFVQFASYVITADGLTVDCRPGPSFGAVGRFFDESGTDFGHAPSLGAYLSDVADSLERGLPFQGGRTWPVVNDGILEWDDSERAHPAWGDPSDPLPSADDASLPPLPPSGSAEPLRAVHVRRLGALGALVATLPRGTVATAAARQMRRLADETGLARYPEVAAALDALGGGRPVGLTGTGPLGLRLRQVRREASAHHDGVRGQAVLCLVLLLTDLPHRALVRTADVRSRISPGWRAALHADLGCPPLPPEPDDAFWAAVDNPAIDAGGQGTGA
ncbi:SMI1/KNR4 family protein [Streptomyces sp. NPDC026673]|uniref:SMI1/KNR4 family protein n=1 Tax=Streptomyces sp. NPDC026673 TaxID=3155724 RepID=UPI0033FD67C7